MTIKLDENAIIVFSEYLKDISNGINYAGTDRRISIPIGKIITRAKEEEQQRIKEIIMKYWKNIASPPDYKFKKILKEIEKITQ